MNGPRDVAIIGAGVVGMATALTLIGHGHRVTLIDAEPGPGLGTSFANGAQLSYAYTDALASPGILSQLPRVLLGMDPALRFRLHLDPDYIAWAFAFLRNTARSRYYANTIAGLELAERSRTALADLTARYALEYAHSVPGKIHVYRSQASFDGAQSMVALKAQHGVRQTLLDPDGAVAIEPMLAPVRAQMVGALLTDGEEVGDPHLFCRSALDAFTRAGGSSRFNTPIAQITTQGDRRQLVTDNGVTIGADLVILANGTASPRLARQLGVRLPVQPMKGYSITLPAGPAAPHASITDVANRVVFARLGDKMRIAGLAEVGNRDTRVDRDRLRVLIDGARAALPGAGDYDQINASWAGLRPMTPNSLPIIRTIAPGVIAATGHGALGWTYAAGTAARVREIIDMLG